MHLASRWAQRLLKLTRCEPTAAVPASTLESFFDEVRWAEDVDRDGRRVLRRAL